jgi:uncharacterized protein YjdB
MKIKFYKSFRSFATAMLAIAILVPGISFKASSNENCTSDELIINGDFEDGLTGWTGPEESLRTNNYFPVSGTYHLTVRNANTEAVQELTDLIPGQTYVLSGYIRNNNSGEEIRLGVRNYGGDELFVEHTANSWPTSAYTIEFTVGAESNSALIFVRNHSGPNWAYADVISVVCKAEEIPVAVTGVTLNETTVELEVGRTFALLATIAPEDATEQTVTWTSSDETVAIVSENGLVTGISEGTATITVTTTDGDFTAEALITVVPAEVADLPLAILPTDDSYVREDNPETIYQDSNPGQLQVRYQSETQKRYSFLKYEIPSTLESLNFNAILKLWGGNSNTAFDLHIVTAENDWDEATLNWENQPDLIADVVPVVVHFPYTDKDFGYFEADITSLISGNEGENVTLVIMHPAIKDENLMIYSKDQADIEKAPTLTFQPIPVTGIVLSRTDLLLELDETFTLSVVITPDNATDQSVVWSTSDESIVTVDEAGLLTAIAEGEAVITATTVDGEFAASANIIVVENLLVNGSFEDGLTEWTGPEASLRTNNYFPITGSYHLTVRNSNTQAVQVVEDLIPGSYVLSGYIRNNLSSVPEEVRMGIRTTTDTLYVSDTFNVWPQEPYNIKFTISEDQSSVEVFVMNVLGSNWAYADNLKLYYAGHLFPV